MNIVLVVLATRQRRIRTFRFEYAVAGVEQDFADEAAHSLIVFDNEDRMLPLSRGRGGVRNVYLAPRKISDGKKDTEGGTAAGCGT